MDTTPASPGYIRCPTCGEEYLADIGVCEDCMLAGIREEESQQEVGWLSLTMEKQQMVQARLEEILAKPDNSDQSYCPRCLEEYRAGFDNCADCDVPLVPIARLVEIYTPRNLVPPEGYEVCSRCGGHVPDDAEVCDDCMLAESGEGAASGEDAAEAMEAVKAELSRLMAQSKRDDVVICPICAVEYRLGFSECSDCQVPLVQPAEMLGIYNQIASGWTPEADASGIHWVEVVDAGVQGHAIVAWKLLADAGIEARSALRFESRNGFGHPRYAIFVQELRLGEAQSILKDLNLED